MSGGNSLIFCDFDGTVATEDVGYRLFHHFSGGKNDELIPDWKAGRLSSRDILTREATMVQATPKELFTFLDSMELDLGFPDFVRLARANAVTPVILSEGLDFYIDYLLKRFGFGDLPIIANRGHLEDNGIRIEFPHRNQNCRTCGSCKGERIDELRRRAASNGAVVFIGDGFSDICAASGAQILFAKKDLAEHCRTRGIDYIEYDNFFDVTSELIRMGILSRQ